MSKVANSNHVKDELILIINDWDRPSPLWGIARVKYLRELQDFSPDGKTLHVTLWQKGHEYKRKGNKSPVLTLDIDAIVTVLNERLTTAVVTSAVQENHKIYLILEAK